MKQMTVKSKKELDQLVKTVEEAAGVTTKTLLRLLEENSSLGVLAAMRFRKIGRDPLDPERPLNLVEQINQTFTYLVSINAVERLFDLHPESAPFRMNLGTRSGYDVESEDGSVVAEVFAAVNPSNNKKLQKDITRVKDSDAHHKYVFFHSPGEHERSAVEGVSVIPLDL